MCCGLQTTKEPERFLGMTKLVRILSKCTTYYKFKSYLPLTSQKLKLHNGERQTDGNTEELGRNYSQNGLHNKRMV
jgi:hypothetical protein